MKHFKKITGSILLSTACLFAGERGWVSLATGGSSPVMQQKAVDFGDALLSQSSYGVDWNVFRTLAPQGANKSIELDLPRVGTVEVEGSLFKSSANKMIWTGKVKGKPYSTVFLSGYGSYLNGKVQYDGQLFLISAEGNGEIVVSEIDLSKMNEEGPHDEEKADALTVAPPTAGGGLIAPPPGNSTIDILILYSQEYKNSFRTDSALNAEIETRIDESNVMYRNSQIGTDLVLLHHQVITSLSNSTTSGSTVANNSEVQRLRDQYGADLVSFWNTNGSAGSGSNFSGSASAAFSTTKKSYIESIYTFTHEVGHNMGGKHDRQTYIDQGRGGELSPDKYRYGKSFYNYRTIMSYANCSVSSCDRILYFTNPNVSYSGTPTGIAYNPSNLITDKANGPADNARRFNDCRATIAAFRTRKITLSSSNNTTSSAITLSSMQTQSSAVTLSSANNGNCPADLCIPIIASGDDVEEAASGSISVTSTDLEMINDAQTGANDQTIGLHFRNVGVPAGSRIDNAWIQFQAEDVGQAQNYLVFNAEKSANASAFTTATNDVTRRSLTSAKTNWAPSTWNIGDRGAAQKTSELKNVIQEVVGLSGWNAGNNMNIIISGNGQAVAESWDGNAQAAPMLMINYTANSSQSSSIQFSSVVQFSSAVQLSSATLYSSTTTSIQEKALANVRIFYGSETLSISGVEGSYVMDIYSVNGSKQKSLQLNGEANISISELPKSAFFIRVKGGFGSKSFKLLK